MRRTGTGGAAVIADAGDEFHVRATALTHVATHVATPALDAVDGDTLGRARLRLRDGLRNDPFERPDGTPIDDPRELEAQRGLESQFIEEQAQTEAARCATFGDDWRTEAKLPFVGASVALFAFCAFVSSALRSPVRNAVTVAWTTLTPDRPQQGEFANKLDPAVLGGVIAGLTTWLLSCVLLPAMNHVAARQRNLPQTQRVPTKVLYPEAGSVGLVRRRRGERHTKFFYRRIDGADAPAFAPGMPADAPTRQAQQQAVDLARRAAQHAQAVRDGGEEARFLQPSLTAFTNWARRAVSTRERLLDSGFVFLESIFASGSAATACALILEGLKVCGVPQSRGSPGRVEVDDLLGGRTHLPLFTLERADPQAPAGTLADLLQSSYWRDALAMSGEILAEVLVYRPRDALRRRDPSVVAAPLWDAIMISPLMDLLLRYATINTGASTASPGWGAFWSQLLRAGAKLDPEPGESVQSPAQSLQQSSQSFMNDFFWQMRDFFATIKFDYVGAALARRELRIGEAVAAGTRAAWTVADRITEVLQAPAASGKVAAGGQDVELTDRMPLDDAMVTRLTDLRDRLRASWNAATPGPTLSVEGIRGMMEELRDADDVRLEAVLASAEVLLAAAEQLQVRLEQKAQKERVRQAPSSVAPAGA